MTVQRELSETAFKLTEAQVKQAVEEWLQYQFNQGNLWYAPLNAGDFIEKRGDTRRRIKGVGKGTADLIVIQPANVQTCYRGQAKGNHHPVARVTFLECKSTTGKQSPEQCEFEQIIKGMHCRYFVVRSLDEAIEILR